MDLSELLDIALWVGVALLVAGAFHAFYDLRAIRTELQALRAILAKIHDELASRG